MDRSDERALLAAVAGGDRTAMRRLYDEHAKAVHLFVRSRLRDEFEASDIVHETMMAVWKSAGRFEGRSALRSWILALARNKMTDHLRRQSRVTVGESDDTVPDEAPEAVAVIAAAQDAERVRACVAKLPERQRAIVHLAFFEELGYAEIARIEGIPEGTVKTRIFHAKKALMHCLGRREG